MPATPRCATTTRSAARNWTCWSIWRATWRLRGRDRLPDDRRRLRRLHGQPGAFGSSRTHRLGDPVDYHRETGIPPVAVHHASGPGRPDHLLSRISRRPLAGKGNRRVPGFAAASTPSLQSPDRPVGPGVAASNATAVAGPAGGSRGRSTPRLRRRMLLVPRQPASGRRVRIRPTNRRLCFRVAERARQRRSTSVTTPAGTDPTCCWITPRVNYSSKSV